MDTNIETEVKNVSETKEDAFYTDALKYWSGVPATLDGMLGGFAHISSTDLSGSRKFLNYFIRSPHGKTPKHRALDCGAGIGRISKRLLLPIFDKVDLVELNPDFLKEAENQLRQYSDKVERYVCSGLQSFTPDANRYDLIWCQWVLGHLTNDDFIDFFIRCREGLTPNGIIIVKENVSTEDVELDEKDSSVTRPKAQLEELFKKAGMTIVKEQRQTRFPREIYDVYMYALR